MKKALVFFVFCTLFGFSLTGQNTLDLSTVDYRVKKYYTTKELQEINLVAPYKIGQLNYLYSESFDIVDKNGKSIPSAKANFDIRNYERFRKNDTRVSFNLTRAGDMLILYSRDEVFQAYNQIQFSQTKK